MPIDREAVRNRIKEINDLKLAKDRCPGIDAGILETLLEQDNNFISNLSKPWYVIFINEDEELYASISVGPETVNDISKKVDDAIANGHDYSVHVFNNNKEVSDKVEWKFQIFQSDIISESGCAPI